mgnify:CR=1 FL=1
MKRATGIGGIFFKTKNPERARDWYRDHLGLDTDQWGTCFEWKQTEDSGKKGFTQWTPASRDSKMFAEHQDFMINYRVSDLTKLVDVLKQEGVKVLDEIEEFEYGKFVHIEDPEGHRIQLWEPNDEEFDKIVDGRTK